MNKTKKLLKNTKNKTCKSKNMTVCCPHMIPTNGKYAATTKQHRLKYLDKNYYFKTCCNACAHSMKDLALSNPFLFKKLYELFGQERTDAEMDDYLKLNFFKRCGGGIGVTRLIRSMKLEGLI